jgi:hypothetical protein
MELGTVLQTVLLGISFWVVRELWHVTVTVGTIATRVSEHERRLAAIAKRLELDAE